MPMFDGNKNCAVCRKELNDKKYFGMNLDGYTFSFCEKCFKTRKDDVKRILNEGQ